MKWNNGGLESGSEFDTTQEVGEGLFDGRSLSFGSEKFLGVSAQGVRGVGSLDRVLWCRGVFVRVYSIRYRK